jgi:hypothetical protein
MAPWKRPWVGAESELLADWLSKYHPAATVHMQVRIGPITPPGEPASQDPAYLRLLSSYQRKVDSVVVYPDRVILVEAAVLPDPGKLGQLEYYLELWPLTPDPPAPLNLPVSGLLLVGQEDAPLRSLAVRKGLAWQVYTPNWLSAYLVSRIPRRNRV